MKPTIFSRILQSESKPIRKHFNSRVSASVYWTLRKSVLIYIHHYSYYTHYSLCCYRKGTWIRGSCRVIERLRCLHLSSQRSYLGLLTCGKCLPPKPITALRWTAVRFVLLTTLERQQTRQASQIYIAVIAQYRAEPLTLTTLQRDVSWRNPRSVLGRHQRAMSCQKHKASFSLWNRATRHPWLQLTPFRATSPYTTFPDDSSRLQLTTVVEWKNFIAMRVRCFHFATNTSRQQMAQRAYSYCHGKTSLAYTRYQRLVLHRRSPLLTRRLSHLSSHQLQLLPTSLFSPPRRPAIFLGCTTRTLT